MTFPGAVVLGLAIGISVAAGVAFATESVAQPVIEIAHPGECIAPVGEMRRNHMEMLKHQRDKTVRLGQRGAKVSLNTCIECHASKKTGSVLGSNENFCQGCHAYAAVSLDCFECHQARTGLARVGVLRP